MCLLIFAHQLDPDYPLVVAANRDEFHARRTQLSQFWPDQPTLLAGKDLELGGIWMGVTRCGRFAAVTNFRDPNQSGAAPRSRGDLSLNFLVGSMSPADYLVALTTRAEQYAGFNLLVGDSESLWYYSNNDRNNEPAVLEPGIYGLSNARLNTPWPKVELGKRTLTDVLGKAAITHGELGGTVTNRELANQHDLKQRGMGSEMEHLLSAQFITSEGYGTRSTTTFWRHANGQCSWNEQSFDATGDLSALQEIEFKLGS
jgi:uncharacterized protein with NRDE domain